MLGRSRRAMHRVLPMVGTATVLRIRRFEAFRAGMAVSRMQDVRRRYVEVLRQRGVAGTAMPQAERKKAQSTPSCDSPTGCQEGLAQIQTVFAAAAEIALGQLPTNRELQPSDLALPAEPTPRFLPSHGPLMPLITVRACTPLLYVEHTTVDRTRAPGCASASARRWR